MIGIGARRPLTRRSILAVLSISFFLTSASAIRAAEKPAFFRYLLSQRPSPALIAFNPNGYDPRALNQPLTPEAARADLAAVGVAFDGLILYAYVPEVTPALVETAAANGFRAVLLGIWDPKSDTEIDGTLALIRKYHRRLAFAVAIGNEGLNDARYTPEDVEQAAHRLRVGLNGIASIPLTTSEPSADYGFAWVRTFGDFLAPNIHPVFDLAGNDPAVAVAWVKKRAQAIARISGRPVLVKETGFPNGGGAAFSPESQARFWRTYLAAGTLLKPAPPLGSWISFAAGFEAFDQPWKADLLGLSLEGHWGLFKTDRHPYPAIEPWRQYREGG